MLDRRNFLAYGGAALAAAAMPSPLLAAVKQNTWIDYVVTFISTLGITVPNFVIAIWLLLFTVS